MAILLAIVPLVMGYDPVADPKATVVFGKFRVTVLTSTLVRMQISSNASFDDRATLQVVHRHLPVPDFTTTTLNDSSIRVTTSDLSLTYVDSKAGKCDTIYQNTDVDGPVRSPNYPDGVSAKTQEECCRICTEDPKCESWIYDTSGKLCYPLLSFASSRPNVQDRVVGTATLKVSISFQAVGADGHYIGPVTWTPSLVNTGNLNGTYSALDCYSTPMQCNEEFAQKMGPGLLSTSGWLVLDDTRTARFTPARSTPAQLPTWWSLDLIDQIDWYFHIHTPGVNHFRKALAEWASVLGAPPMLPRQAFGVWWSRYYPYSQSTLVNEVLSGYANYSIPLSTVVLDMDWHNEPQDKGCKSWGNYDVNETLWPDMTAFARSAHEYGVVTGHPLQLSLNIHPETGVDYCDKRYPAIASAMGVDPITRQTIPCDFGNQTFTESIFSIYLDADPLHAVDVWWTDYGGCGVAAGQPLLWSNRVMYDHVKNGRHLRGHAFSRYGGLGNHRYPHGFSGDTFQHEVALYWQIKTTQTASNVLFGYWSHDIGGFHDGQGCPGDHDPKNVTGAELLLRWIQFGAVSPILRTHCDHCERRIWLFPYFESMRDAMRLRNALVPYIYTASRINYDTAIAAVHPLYYDFPYDGKVFTPSVVDREYMFGDSILASPISTMSDGKRNAEVKWTTYLPQSQVWVNWNGTHVYTGSQSISVLYSAADIPLFVRAGAIIPMQTHNQYSDVAFPDSLVWSVWPGMASGQTTLYEDDGSSDAYIGGQYVLTNASFSGDPSRSSTFVFTIAPATVSAALPDGFPRSRSHALHLRGFSSFWTSVSSAKVNGSPIPSGTGSPGYYIISAADHSLTHPQGTLVVSTGSGLSTFSSVTIALSLI